MKVKVIIKSAIKGVKFFFFFCILISLNTEVIAQSTIDSSIVSTKYTGNIGITNNGFSIVPTFSFNSPAIISQMSWKKNKFSIEPDIRLAPDGTKGSILLWFRYNLINTSKFSLRSGIHPAVNWFPKNILINENVTEIYQLRRFLAWELAPNIKINNHINTGVYYLQGNGLQQDGARTTHFVNFYLGMSNINIGKQLKLNFVPSFYYLYLDKKEGTYFTATSSINHKKYPFSLQSTINKTIQTSIEGGKDFLWNIAFVHFLNTKK
jgi:hypothetical protein